MTSLIWLAITLVFTLLIVFQVKLQPKKMENIVLRGVKSINGVSSGLVETEQALNKFIDEFNRANKTSFTISLFSYILAAITSVISCLLSF